MNKAVLLMLAALPLCAQAVMYRWVDEKGKVHYGDRPVGNEVKRVPGLLEPKAAEALPAPGMKSEELRQSYGEPERVQTIVSKNGETLIWTYRKSKQVSRDFVVKIERGEVVEVLTDSASDNSRAAVSTQPSEAEMKARAKAAEAAEYQREQESAESAAVEKERRCTSLRENLQRIESRQRRGGSGATMDSLREQQHKASDSLSAEGC